MEWKQELMGKRVKFTHRLIKHNRSNVIKWHPMKYEGVGMVIGRRWVYNGRTDWDGDGYKFFVQDEAVPCLAVVRNDRENHIYIPYDCFELLEAEDGEGREGG